MSLQDPNFSNPSAPARSKSVTSTQSSARPSSISHDSPTANTSSRGKTVTGFANVEEDFAENAVWNMNLLPRDRHVMPWRIEDALRARGANFIQAGLWRAFAVRDGNLVTGQQNFSGTETARLVIETLGRQSTTGSR